MNRQWIKQARERMFPRNYVFLGHEPCPKCRAAGKDTSGNNMGRWEDGHTFCYAGHGIINGSDRTLLLDHVAAMQDKQSKEKKVVSLPDDASNTIAADGLYWLAKYGIMKDEVREQEILWSDFRQQLLFPIRDAKGNLMAYQARNFKSDAKTKWWSQGELDSISHVIEPKDHTYGAYLCVVEDIVSAIKVGRHIPTMCLFGSNLSLRRALQLRFLTNNLVFWLDHDKFKESMRYSKQLEMYGIDTRCIFTEKDPKEYDDSEIINFLRA